MEPEKYHDIMRDYVMEPMNTKRKETIRVESKEDKKSRSNDEYNKSTTIKVTATYNSKTPRID